MKLVLNSASSILIAVTVAIVSTLCVTETMSLDIGGFVDGVLTVNGTSTNISSAIESILQNDTYADLIQDTETVLDLLFNETNATEAWNVMKEYLDENNIDLAPDGYFKDILSDTGNYSNYLEGNAVINGTIDWNATYIIAELFNRTNLTQTWENIKTNVTTMIMNTSMPSSMGSDSMAPVAAPAAVPTMDMKTMAPAMDKPSMDTKTMAPATTPTMSGNMTNSTTKPQSNSTSAATTTTVKVIGTSFLAVFVTATSSMFFAL